MSSLRWPPSPPSARSRAFAVGVGVALLASRALACVDLDALGRGGARPEAGTEEAAAADAGDAAPACDHKTPPATSSDKDDSPGDELPRFALAVDRATLDPKEAPGYDLDALCTCLVGGAEGAPSCRSKAAACDLANGVDNTVAQVAEGATVLTGSRVDAVPNRLIAQGRRTLLLEIGRYNGRANDAEVAIGALLSEGITSPTCPASTLEAATGTYTPGRCGRDEWTISPASIVANTPLVVGTGYVRDFRIVVRLTTPLLVPFTVDSTFRVDGATLTGTLVPLGEDLKPRDATRPPTDAEKALYRLDDAVIAGRTATADTLRTLGSYRRDQSPLCASPAFDAIRERICDSADVLATGARNADAPCDALSIAFGVAASPARRGALSDAGTTPLDCAPAATDSVLRCP